MLRTSMVVLTMVVAVACGPQLPMSVDDVFNEAGNDANKLSDVINRHHLAELQALHQQFESGRKGSVYRAGTWKAYASKAKEIDDGYADLRKAVFKEFEIRSK